MLFEILKQYNNERFLIKARYLLCLLWKKKAYIGHLYLDYDDDSSCLWSAHHEAGIILIVLLTLMCLTLTTSQQKQTVITDEET